MLEVIREGRLAGRIRSFIEPKPSMSAELVLIDARSASSRGLAPQFPHEVWRLTNAREQYLEDLARYYNQHGNNNLLTAASLERASHDKDNFMALAAGLSRNLPPQIHDTAVSMLFGFGEAAARLHNAAFRMSLARDFKYHGLRRGDVPEREEELEEFQGGLYANPMTVSSEEISAVAEDLYQDPKAEEYIFKRLQRVWCAGAKVFFHANNIDVDPLFLVHPDTYTAFMNRLGFNVEVSDTGRASKRRQEAGIKFAEIVQARQDLARRRAIH